MLSSTQSIFYAIPYQFALLISHDDIFLFLF